MKSEDPKAESSEVCEDSNAEAVMESSSLFYYIGCLPVLRFHMLSHMSNLCVVGWNEINSELQLPLSPGDQNLNRCFTVFEYLKQWAFNLFVP